MFTVYRNGLKAHAKAAPIRKINCLENITSVLYFVRKITLGYFEIL